jgi:uncharacterized membrane protein
VSNSKYYWHVTCAAVIAAMGLLTNSSVAVVASMLVSPIMGPIVEVCREIGQEFNKNKKNSKVPKRRRGSVAAATAALSTSYSVSTAFITQPFVWFASIIGLYKSETDIKTKNLIKEMRSLFLCVLIGMLFGFLRLSDAPFLVEDIAWPTNEMLSRANLNGLLLGVFIAVPSAVVVAFDNLKENINSSVGVAISASLLPPAVNAGIMWSLAIGGYPGRASWFADGSVSLLLTLINIVIIIVIGSGIFSYYPDKNKNKEDTEWRNNPMLEQLVSTAKVSFSNVHNIADPII